MGALRKTDMIRALEALQEGDLINRLESLPKSYLIKVLEKLLKMYLEHSEESDLKIVLKVLPKYALICALEKAIPDRDPIFAHEDFSNNDLPEKCKKAVITLVLKDLQNSDLIHALEAFPKSDLISSLEKV